MLVWAHSYRLIMLKVRKECVIQKWNKTFFLGFNIFYTIRSIHNADTVSPVFSSRQRGCYYIFILYKPVHYSCIFYFYNNMYLAEIIQYKYIINFVEPFNNWNIPLTDALVRFSSYIYNNLMTFKSLYIMYIYIYNKEKNRNKILQLIH